MFLNYRKFVHLCKGMDVSLQNTSKPRLIFTKPGKPHKNSHQTFCFAYEN